MINHPEYPPLFDPFGQKMTCPFCKLDDMTTEVFVIQDSNGEIKCIRIFCDRCGIESNLSGALLTEKKEKKE